MKRKDGSVHPQVRDGCAGKESLAPMCKIICDILAWVARHRGCLPAQRGDDPQERSLAQAYKRLKTRRDKQYVRGSTKPSDQKLTDQEVKHFDVIATAMQIEAGMPGIMIRLLPGLGLMRTVDAFEPLRSRLQALRVSGSVTPGGLANLDRDSITPWSQAFPVQQDRGEWEKVAQQLGCYIWWIDLFVCDCTRPKIASTRAGGCDDYPHPESSLQCRVVWSGVVGAPTYVHDEGVDDFTGPWREDFFRFAVDAHIDDAMPECTEECPPYCVCEYRVICISLPTLQVVMHADTRRAEWEEFCRHFVSPSRTEAVSMSVVVQPKGDAQGYVFRHLDIETRRYPPVASHHLPVPSDAIVV